ncbi:polysaccharide biosynthesis C-terminal domain-containing protein [Bulleidia sp. zg-1006]|uniref:oligosaccharide flippase family protein n=1 Tax=Bulleidia sp. zg-1006 TaxID=2806552 RepID=UPI001939AE07|nr:polysaccharide biosynthesis C-terminal domain-containing protein [Bulleidia sp. zg-1006]QRG86033.1 oligosaccharide flippase family protein [Bulleidia sp. zg-1006]
MSEKLKKEVGQSFLAGSLTSTAGIFIAKLIGLFYIIPFKEIVGQQNMVFFSASYDYYALLLQISGSGIPFAIAALVAKYYAKEDYKTVMLVRRLGTGILMASGFVMAMFFFLMSAPLATRALGGGNISAWELKTMQNVFSLLALALFIVPILYSYRGYYQGLKEMRAYAGSQVLEQVGRVAFILAASMIGVYVFKMHRSFGAYASVIGTSLGAILAIFYFAYFDTKRNKRIARLAKRQEREAVSYKIILKEFLMYAIPFFVTAILGNSQILVNTNLFVSVNQSLGMNHNTATLIYSIIQTNCDKLTSIPQVVASGFSAGIIPFVTAALENQNWKEMRKYLMDAFDVTFFFAIPVSSVLFFQSRAVYYIMYGGGELVYGQVALRQAGILAFTSTLTPLMTSILLTLRFRKTCIGYLGIGFLVKLISFYPLTALFGYTGAIISSYVSGFAIFFLGFYKITAYSKLQWKVLLRRFLKILLISIIMNIPYYLLKLVGFDFVHYSRAVALILFIGVSMMAMAIYFALTEWLRLVQVTFHRSLKLLLNRMIRRA